MSDRPRSNKSRTLQGVKNKRKKKGTSKEKIQDAKSVLRDEILRDIDPDLHAAFDAFGEGCDLDILTKMVGMEFVRLQRSLAPGEVPDFRYWAAMNKIVDQLRRLITIREGSETFIPDAVTMLLGKLPKNVDRDKSDVPEFS